MKLTITLSTVFGLCLAAAPMSAQLLDPTVIQGVAGTSESALLSKAAIAESGGRKLNLHVDTRLVRGLTSAVLERAQNILIDLGPELFGGQNYGKGWPGTLGIPGLSHLGLAAPGASISLFAENSTGFPTIGHLYAGFSSAAVETSFGGLFLVTPDLAVMRLKLSSGTTQIPFTIPRDALFYGSSVFLQSVIVDAGAAGGMAMSRGLELFLQP